MKIIIFSRPQLAHTANEVRSLIETIRLFGFDFAVNKEFSPIVEQISGESLGEEQIYTEEVGEQRDDAIMVCYGGDGTLLEGVHRLGGAPIPVMGINAGHLGFLTSASNCALHSIFEQIAAKTISIEERSMVEVSGDFIESHQSRVALNEVTVQRLGAGMISVETYIDSQIVATFHGDGAIVATPTGSTAYSLSAGGPIVAPSCRCLVISPLAPHNLTMRPLVIPDTSVITLKVCARHSDAYITLDNRLYNISREVQFTVKRAEQRLFLALPHNISFYDTLRNKMMWGVDVRIQNSKFKIQD